MTQPIYSVNHYLCPANTPLTDFCSHVASAGFNGIGLTEAALSEVPLHSLRKILKEHQLSVSSINSAGFFLSNNPEQEKKNLQLLDYAHELNAHTLNVIVGALDPSIRLGVAREIVKERLALFANYAHSAGVKLVIEPLSIANIFSKSCLHTIREVKELIAHIPTIKLNLDYYHLWADPELDETLRLKDKLIGLIQICNIDWELSPNTAKRAPLGEGKLTCLEQLNACSWDFTECPLELELFIEQLPERNFSHIIHNASRYLSL